MNGEPMPASGVNLPADAAGPRPYWGWLVALGAALIALSALALGSLPVVTEAYVIYFGFVLLASGAGCALQALRTPVGEGFFLLVVSAVLDVVVGLLMVTHVGGAAALMTLLLAVFFMAGGLVRIFVSLALRFPGWGWTLFAGVIALILGVSIWRQWPYSAIWVPGLFIGVELLMRGWSLVMLGLALRGARSPRSTL